jgi:phage FluMu protein Com
MKAETSNFGPRLYCPLCKTICLIQAGPIVHEWQADGAAICKNAMCGYTATVGVFYRIPGRGQPRVERRPVELKEGELRAYLELQCPECQGTARVRTSTNKSPFLKLLYIYCECCEFKGQAFVEHLEILHRPMKGELMRDLPLHPRLRQAYINEFGYDPDAWRYYDNDGTRKNNALRTGAASAGHRSDIRKKLNKRD